ncbi:MAG: WG repeat-containing protein [Eubacteriales bacterium]
MRLFNETAKRVVAFVLLAVVAFGAITYSLGFFELSFIDRGGEVTYDDTTAQEILGTLETGTNISDFTGDNTTELIIPVDSSATGDESSSGTTSGDVTSAEGTDPSDSSSQAPEKYDTLDEYLDAGYKITWANYDPTMQMAQLILTADGLDEYTYGTQKRVYVKKKMDYGEAHREIEYYTTKRVERAALEVYMGYILVDAGKGQVSSGIGDNVYENADRVSIYNSVGKLIGTYPGDEVIPANCRDRADRAVFIYEGAYYYLDSQTGRFELSDFNPQLDSRGLEFDYNPDFGKSDNRYSIYNTVSTVTETFELDTVSYFTPYGVDSRLAEQLYLAYPGYANFIAREFQPGHYYNRLFCERLKEVIKGVESGEITRPETTTEEPETTAVPDDTTSPIESDTTIPEDTTVIPDDTTTAPGDTSSPIESDTTIPDDTTSTPDDTTLPGESDTTISDDTTVMPDDTTAVPDDTSTPDESDTVAPEQTGHVITEDTSPVPPASRAIIASPNDSDKDGIPDKLTVTLEHDEYRFTYRVSEPKVDLSKNTVMIYTHNPFIYHKISWQGDFKYAKAYNFSENRAYTVDDNGIVKIINTYGTASVYMYKEVQSDTQHGSYYRICYYTEPFERDEYKLGHYYFDDGLIRMRAVERLTYKLNEYEADYEVMVDAYGNQVDIVPSGYTVISYSEGVFLLERSGTGRYGYYHKDGYWVAQPIYTYAAPFIEGLAVLGYEDGIKGVIDTNGNIVIPFHYTSISNASTGIFACYSDEEGWKVFAKVKK